MATAMMLTACSSESSVTEEEKNPESEISAIDNTSYAVMPKLNGDGNDAISRSMLYYDYNTGGAMFGWSVNADQIGVSPVVDIPQNTTIVPYKIDGLVDQAGLVGYFGKKNEGDGFVSFDGRYKYVSYYPYSATASYEEIPVDYTGQRQTSNPEIYYYRYRSLYQQAKFYNGSEEEFVNHYIDTEKAACVHLPVKDYLTAGPTTTTGTGKLHFSMKRMGAIIRFFIVVPEVCSYNRLQVYNPNEGKPFVLQTTMNAATQDFNDPTKTSNSIYLDLGADENGIVFAEYASEADPIYKYSKNYNHLLIAYMMVAPMNLKEDGDKNCVLYLHHNYGQDGHKVFKAELATIDIKQDWVNQWTIASMEEAEPIIFGLQELSVQQWKDETEYDNTEAGNGTSKW